MAGSVILNQLQPQIAIHMDKVERDPREVLIIPKRSLGEFIFLELIIYMSQVCVFGIVAFLGSQAGSSKEKMVQSALE